MILVCRAEYDCHTDSVQVPVLLQEDDGSAATPRLSHATVELLHHDTVMFEETLTRDDVVLWQKTGADEPSDNGQFFFFLLHPPAQQQLNARVRAFMTDGEEGVDSCPVRAPETQRRPMLQQPKLPGRDPVQFKNPPEFP